MAIGGQTVAEIRAWEPVLAPHAVIVFDDYVHPAYPGVKEAVEELGLIGQEHRTMFVHQR